MAIAIPIMKRNGFETELPSRKGIEFKYERCIKRLEAAGKSLKEIENERKLFEKQ